MKRKRAVLMAGVGLLSVPALLPAHHALSVQFDTTQTITLTGSVKNIDWRNPHVRLFLDVRNASHDAIWEVDMGSPNQQFMNGWKIDTYRRGDHVTVDAYPARDGSMVVYGRKISRSQ